jgi:hypothetical protein
MEGRWYTTSGGGGFPGGLLALVLLVIVGGGIAEGVARAVASLVTILLIAAVVIVVVLAGAAATVLVVTRTRHPDRERRPTRMIPRPQFHQLAAPEAEQPSIEAPRELHTHWHFHGVDEDRVAEILRRHKGAE